MEAKRNGKDLMEGKRNGKGIEGNRNGMGEKKSFALACLLQTTCVLLTSTIVHRWCG